MMLYATYLFILSTTAGVCVNNGNTHYCTPVWKQSWTSAALFSSEEACDNAAKQLRLAPSEFRCVTESVKPSKK